MAGVNQHLQTVQFYRPYDSEDESGSDSETASTNSWFSYGMDQSAAPTQTIEGHPDFKAFATQMQLIDAGGRSFSTIRDEIVYGNDRLGKYTVYSQYDAPKPQPDLSGEEFYGRSQFQTQDGSETTIVMIDSRYRDRQAYPQPTYCTLRLPRIYKNITSINMVEMKLLTSFYFFRLSKANTDITVYERDRTTLRYDGTTVSTIVKRYIDEGSYNINQLQAEIQQKLNYTPLFYDFPNGFSDFVNIFKPSGDYGVNFNEAGDWFYNNTTNQWIANPTKDTIILHFWKQRFAGLTNYTQPQLQLAYYYPVLSEAIQDEEYNVKLINLQPGIGVDPTVQTTDDVRNRILYTFQGINPPDPVVLAVVQANLPALDKYRLEHTFRYYLVNKYVVGRDAQSQRVYITSPSLNTSLVTLLNLQQAKFFQQALQLNGITAAQYAQLSQQVAQTLAVINAMYDFEQERFLDYFAVPWAQYGIGYYADFSNYFQLRNGENVVGIATNYGEAYNVYGVSTINTNILLAEQSNPPYYWPNLTSTPTTTIGFVNLSSQTSSFNYVYRPSASNFDLRTPVIDPSTNLFYTEFLTNTVNAVCPIESGKYTTFQFQSPVRQTLQVETLPRPTAYRIPAYNLANYDSTINEFFDISYAYKFTSTFPYAPTDPLRYATAFDNLQDSNLKQIPGWSPQNATSNNSNYSWTRNYSTSVGQYASSFQLDILQPNRALYFQFTTPQVSTPTVSQNSSFTYSLNLGIQFYEERLLSTLSTPTALTRVLLYQDRGGFQGDVIRPRNETNLFYKASTIATTQDVSANITFTTYPNQTYYVIVRPDDTNFGTIFPRIFPWFSSTFTLTQQTKSIDGINPQTDINSPTFSNLIQTNYNYAQVYDSNFIQLPTYPTSLWDGTPSSNPANAVLSISNVPMGYDTQSNVSTDWTDYIPYGFNSFTQSFNPSSNLAIDPINKFLFQSNEPYNTSTQTYLYSGGNNAIFVPAIQQVYTPGTVPARQYKIVNYYSVNYLPESDENYPIPPALISNQSNAQLPYTTSTTQNVYIPGYQYGGGTQSTLQLGKGVLGFNFIPSEGVWDLKKLVFRSAIQDSNADPNSNIHYIGVYNLYDILSTNTLSLSMSSALTVLSNSARVSYTSTFTLENNGFDVKGGTYYEFTKDTTFTPSVQTPILGYTQSESVMSDQPESMYTTVAFDQYGTPTTIKALSGSAIPYPYYNQVFVSTNYLDGTKSYNPGQGVLFPSTIGQMNWPFASSLSTLYAPPVGNDGTQAEWGQSIGLGTTVVNYKQGLALNQNESYFLPWATTLTPNKIVATVPNYVMAQDTGFSIYEVTSNQPTRALDTPVYTLSADEIFSGEDMTSLVSASGNSTYLYFLGLSNDGTNTSNYLRIKRFDPTIGYLYDYIPDNTFRVPFGGTVRSFTINDAEQIVLSYQNPTNITEFYYNMLPSTNMTSVNVTAVAGASNTAIHTMDPTNQTVYWLPIATSSNIGSNQIYRWTLGTSFPGTQFQTTGAASLPSNWSGLAVTSSSNIPASQDRLYLTSQLTPYTNQVYYSSNFDTTLNQVSMTNVSTPITTVTGTANPITSIQPGCFGSIWMTTASNQMVWANRNSEVDTGGLLTTAWQVFYPFQKIVLEKLANQYNPITDLTYLDGPEFMHTAMFYYPSTNVYTNDTKNQWGLEKNGNFFVGDPAMQGYYFNSYIFNVPLRQSAASNDILTLTVRGYSPTETGESLIRFVLPNRYDFGFLTQWDLFNEIALLQTTERNFNPVFLQTLSNFDVAFQQSNSYFGQGLLPNFDGSNFNSSNFQQFASNYSTIYQSYQANATLLSNITTYVQSNMLVYISTQLQYILPPSASARQNFTDPLTFQLLWYSGLLPQYRPLLEDWGLGYNLGYAKRDTVLSTYHQAESFYKILEDYIYLRLNPEYPMNRLDTTYKENFKITRDSTGQVNNFHGKLLLNEFNTYSRSFVSNQVTFNPPIGRLDQMYFEWVNIVGDRIDNFDCEWSCSLNIVENKNRATVQSTLPALPKPK